MRSALLLPMLFAFLLCFGCSPSGIPEPAEENAASAVQSEYPHQIGSLAVYYTGGPQQGRPPDGEFEPGTRVKVLHHAGSYSMVRSADGIEAYVSTAAIQPAGGTAPLKR